MVRRWLVLGGVTGLCVPLALLFLFTLLWFFPSRNGYPACDPDFQPWCEHDPLVTVGWYAGVGSAAAGVLCLAVAFVPRVRNWWMWAIAAPTLLLIGLCLFGLRSA